MLVALVFIHQVVFVDLLEVVFHKVLFHTSFEALKRQVRSTLTSYSFQSRIVNVVPVVRKMTKLGARCRHY